MVYAVWLFGLSLLFVAWERLRPRRSQPVFRRGIWTDIGYIVFNGEYLGVLMGAVTIHTIAWLDRGLDLSGLRSTFYMGIMSKRPIWLQIALLLVVFDFIQWAIHNLLHRVPALWEVHKVHHSIEEMDWIGNWRFHWFEIVVYRTLMYPFAAFFGFAGEAMFWYGIVNTFVGHFAHANVNIAVGPLKYLVNSPEMHLWHHTHPDAGPVDKNFGISLAVWDWIFGTAFLPEREDPERLGFEGVERYPGNFFTQLFAPVAKR